MSLYVDDKIDGQNKEFWLVLNAATVSKFPPTYHYDPENDCVAVCLVGNDGFSAALILHNALQLRRTCNPQDFRPKVWFMVKREALLPFLHGQEIESCPL